MTLQGIGALSAEDLSTIQSSSHVFGERMVAREFDALMKLYTHDVVFMPPNHPAVEGKEALRTWLDGFPKARTFSLSISDIGGYGDVAYVRGHAKMTLQSDDGSGPVEEVMKYVEIRKKQVDGSWPISVDIFNSDNE